MMSFFFEDFAGASTAASSDLGSSAIFMPFHFRPCLC